MQKTSVTTARPKAMILHGVPALFITSDTPTIVSPQACWLIILKTNHLEMMMDIAIHKIVVAFILIATLVINMIAGNSITSQMLVTAWAKVTMPNIKAILGQNHDHNQGQSPRHNHGHYRHHDDTRGRKQSCSPVALSCLRSEHKPSPPQAKSPSVLHQALIVELKTTALVHQIANLFLRTLSLTRWIGHHLHIIVLLWLHQMTISVRFWMPAMVLTVPTISHHPLPQCASGMSVMKTLTALIAPRIKNICARGLKQSNRKENSFGDLKVIQDTYHTGQCS